MKIYVDVTVLTMATFVTGIQRVTGEFAVRLAESREMELILLHYNAAKDTYYKIDNKAFVDFYKNKKGKKEKMITKEAVPLGQIGEGTVFFDLDAAWMCRLKRSYLLPILKKQGAKIVAHIYDIISITHPRYCLERGVYNFMDYIGAHLQYADEFVVNAQATADELKGLAKRLDCTLQRCVVVPLGADFHGGETAEVKEVKGPFVLMVGTIEPRKNHKLLLEAYDNGLKQAGLSIVLAGYMGWNMEEFEQKLKEHPDFGKGIYHFTGLSDKEISFLYQNAKCLVFASYAEGYGLPVIEALQRGTPVVAADIPVLREVGGDYCAWFKQDNVTDLTEKVLSVGEENKIELQKIIGKFPVVTWEESFEKLSKVLANEG